MKTEFKLGLVDNEYKLILTPVYNNPENLPESLTSSQILRGYKTCMIEALYDRQNHCAKTLEEMARNDEIIGENEYAYFYRNGRHFSKRAYAAMEKAMKLIDSEDWNKLASDRLMMNQLLKALTELFVKTGNTSQVLLDCAMEMLYESLIQVFN